MALEGARALWGESERTRGVSCPPHLHEHRPALQPPSAGAQHRPGMKLASCKRVPQQSPANVPAEACRGDRSNSNEAALCPGRSPD